MKTLLNEIKKLRYLRHGFRNYWFGEDMPYLRLWLPKRAKLLQRMLGWPIVWRLAAKAALLIPHEPVDAECVACFAKARIERDRHKPTMTTARQLVCRECGLSVSDWKRKPLCRHKPLWPTPPPREKSGPVVFPLNWD